MRTRDVLPGTLGFHRDRHHDGQRCGRRDCGADLASRWPDGIVIACGGELSAIHAAGNDATMPLDGARDRPGGHDGDPGKRRDVSSQIGSVSCAR